MKKIFSRAKLTIMLVTFVLAAKSQIPPDRWDTLYKVTTVAPVNHFNQCNNAGLSSKLFLFGDTVNTMNYTSTSYIAAFNPTTSVFTAINYTRTATDYGINGNASITTSTPNLSYLFLGAKVNPSLFTASLTLYRVNSVTNAVTSESMPYPGGATYHNGIAALCFFSPSTNHDSLIIFDDSSYQAINIYKKKYNQSGFVNSNISIPVQYLSKTFVFNNVLWVSGSNPANSSPTLLNSNDGITFTVNTNFISNVGYKIKDMDTLNGELYMGIDNQDGAYAIYKTPDGINYTQLVPITPGTITSLKSYKNGIWYSVSNGRPSVYYLSSPSFTLPVQSAYQIGEYANDGYSYHLNTLNNELLFSGNYADYSQATEFGTIIYKFIPPVANFTMNVNPLCLGSFLTYSNTSVNADSVRWILDNNYYASASNSFSFSYNTTGSHTVGLIAISGTQTDTLLQVLTVYSVTASASSPSLGCQDVPVNVTSAVNGAVGASSYTWLSSTGFSVSSAASASTAMTATTAGTYTFALKVTDSQGCQAQSSVSTITINGSKNISGLVTTQTLAPVAGTVTLYRYEPFLTKFDSIDSQVLDVAGGYTFGTLPAFTYILKCIPSANSLQITYGNSEINWKTANIITHGCITGSTQNIDVIPLTSLGSGPGELSGTITEGVGYGQKGSSILVPGNPIKGIIVKGGRNPGGDIGAQARTNAAGQYTLQNMPVNNPGESYFILVDIPGLDTNNTYHRVITLNTLQFTNLDFVVDSARINPVNTVGLQELLLNTTKIILYPNPTNDLVNINFNLIASSEVSAELSDITGRTVKTLLNRGRYTPGEMHITAQLDNVKPGVYFVTISINSTEKTTKLIITR
ncbi:MAG: T9SS type A sorting domain-containing protein [Bacteroidia bacterium]